MNKIKLNVWGRDFNLDVIYDVYSGEDILDSQLQALETFQNKAGLLLADASKIVEYCQKDAGTSIEGEITNIFKYVMPTSVFIKRTKEKNVVALMCDYRFDEEHGIAVVFEDEKFKKIGPQEII